MTRTLVWLRSQRDAVEVYDRFTRPRLEWFRKVAADVGFDLRVATVDDFTVEIGPAGRPRLVLAGSALEPRESIFHTATMTWPAYAQDEWRYQSFAQLLVDLGFCVTVPPEVSRVAGDKYLTLMQGLTGNVPVIPTIRVMTRQYGRLQDVLPAQILSYPVAVKPANWGSGFGIVRATSKATLDAALQLAGAAELTMVLQPWIDGLRDYRVYCFNGEPEAAMIREPRSDAFVASMSHGAAATRISVPPWAREPARLLATALDAPYLCVDFVATATEFWLSEIEVDGGILGTAEFQDLLPRRFEAYRRHFETFAALASRPDPEVRETRKEP